MSPSGWRALGAAGLQVELAHRDLSIRLSRLGRAERARHRELTAAVRPSRGNR